MATQLVQGGRIKNGMFEAYDKASKSYVSTGQKVNANDFGKTEVGKATPYTGANPLVSAYSNNYKPTPKNVITSSNSVLSDKNKMDARIQAGAALTSDPSSYGSGFSFSPQQTGYMDMLGGQQTEYLKDQQNLLNAVSLKFDAALRRSNQQYGSLMSDLEQNLQNDVAMATQQAAALNPYSESAGAMTARNFTSAIQSKYQNQALKIQQQAEAAEEALRAGQIEAYTQISNQMKDSQRQFQKGMMDYMISAQSEFNKNQQWQQEFGLKQQAFNLESAQAYEGNFFDFIDTFGADPNFKGEIDNYFQTGQISDTLMPLVKRGLQAGLSASEAISVAQYETINQTKLRQDQEQFNQQLALGWYNAETSRTKAIQDALAANQAISDVRAEKANVIIDNGMRAFDIINQGLTRTSGIGATASLWLPGEATQADTLQGYYDTILNNISLTEMQKLKDESKQGSTGFGNQSDKEFTTLRESLGKLNSQNDPQTQKENLARIMAAQHNIVQLHAAATGQSNQSPVLVTYQDILNEFSASAPSATEWVSPNGNTYKFNQ